MFNRLLQFFLYSNVWIGLAAVALFAETHMLLDHNPGLFSRKGLFIFAATVFVYGLHRLVSLDKYTAGKLNPRFLRIQQWRKLLYLFVAVSGVSTLILLPSLSLNEVFWLGIPAIISLLYVLPVFPERKRLRDITYLKIALVALVWTWLTVGLPFYSSEYVAQSESPFWNHQLFWSLAIERFTYIFAITIPFELRDQQLDLEKKVNTLAHRFSFIQLQKLSVGLIVFGTAIYLIFVPLNGKWGVLIANLFVVFLLRLPYIKYDDYFFTGILDGHMILRALVVYISLMV